MPRYASQVRLLVFAGALPFVAAALLVLLPLLPRLDARPVFDSYLLVILAFLCGSHWGQGLAARGSLPLNLFLLSNAVVVALWLGQQFLPSATFLLLGLTALLLLLWVDARLHAAEAIDTWYYLTRKRITLIVMVCVVLVLLA